MPELRHIAMTEEEAKECHRLALWHLTPPDEEWKVASDGAIVQLIRDKTAMFKSLRDLLKQKKLDFETAEAERPIPWAKTEKLEAEISGIEAAYLAVLKSVSSDELDDKSTEPHPAG